MSTENEIQIPADYVRPSEAELATLKAAAAQGGAEANSQLGNYYLFNEDVRDLPSARAHYQTAADQGHAKAQLNLAVMYNLGEGVEVDFNKARALYEQAAEQGYAKAQHNLAIMYDLGEGVEVDFNKARALYEQAAEQGHAEAQFNLAVMYNLGEGVKKDNIKAAELLLASKQHDKAYLSLAADLYKELTAEAGDALSQTFENATAGKETTQKHNLAGELLRFINDHTPATSEPVAEPSAPAADQ